MQKISQIHSCIWKLEFHAHFLPQPPEIIKVVLNFLEFTSVYKKSAQFIHSFIHSPYDQCLTTISDHTHPNIFLSTLNFWYQHVKKQTISSLCSRDIFDLKSCNLIGQHHFGPIWLRNKLTNLLILRLAKKMIEKTKKTKNGFHHHDVKL